MGTHPIFESDFDCLTEKMGLELIYFDVQGRATGIRIMLKMAGVDYKDTRVECDKAVWQAQKPDFDKLALGQLPIMKIDDRVYCQQDAIEEYCALKAGIVPKSAEDVMRVKMLLETMKEAGLKTFMGAIQFTTAQIGGEFFGLEGEKLEERNKIFVPKMIELMSALNGNIEKVLNFKRTGEYAVGDSITLADMEIFKYSQFAKDPLFNKYGDMQAAFEKSSPTMVKIAAKVAQHPIVQEYLKTEGHLPYTGMNILW